MAIGFLKQVQTSISRINPADIRTASERRVRVLLQAANIAGYARMEDFLAPANLSPNKRMEAAQILIRAAGAGAEGRFQLVFFERGSPLPDGWEYQKDAFMFDPEHPQRLVEDLLEHRDELGLPLSRLFPAVRDAVVKKTIHSVAKENALFSIMTALPNIIPSAIELPWIVGEFASDTAVLTGNQIRMAFLLAAASDRAVGFKEQRSEIGSIVAGAWGWRAVSRQLVSKIPFGGGVIAKAAIAYAGTYVVGLSLERVYRIGSGLTRAERSEAYDVALEKGKEVAASLFDKVRRK